MNRSKLKKFEKLLNIPERNPFGSDKIFIIRSLKDFTSVYDEYAEDAIRKQPGIIILMTKEFHDFLFDIYPEYAKETRGYYKFNIINSINSKSKRSEDPVHAVSGNLMKPLQPSQSQNP